MIFADSDFYKKEYLLGRAEIIPFDEFLFWARKASDRINWRKITLQEIPEALSLCTCEVAEAFYIDSEKEFMSMEPSQSVGAYSKGVVSIKQEQTDFNIRVDAIIRRHLASSDLHNQFVFRGGGIPCRHHI